MDHPIITLTTDFGTTGTYVAQMKGVILGINPRATIVDISHSIQPQAVVEGSYAISNAHHYFPKGTIHVVVVDPGVGTSRHPLLLSTPTAHYLAPDNGVLSQVLLEGYDQPPEVLAQIPQGAFISPPRGYRAYQLTVPKYWRHPVSNTFHGRDIFAPVAAHLSLGVTSRSLGRKLDLVRYLPAPMPYQDGDSLVGEVREIDHYGNLVTNIPASTLLDSGEVNIQINDSTIFGLSSNYADSDNLLAIIGSGETLEIAVRNGNAAKLLQAAVGDPVRVTWHASKEIPS
jgi:S-adenosylmethionine hydrolase